MHDNACLHVARVEQDQYSPLHLSLTLPLKPIFKGGEKRKFKVKVIAENMGPGVYRAGRNRGNGMTICFPRFKSQDLKHC